MTDLRVRMIEDRHLRNSARALIEADVQNLRTGLSGRSLATRAVDRLKGGAQDVYDEAVAVASDNKGVLAALVAALALWLVRNPLRALLGFPVVDDAEDENDLDDDEADDAELVEDGADAEH